MNNFQIWKEKTLFELDFSHTMLTTEWKWIDNKTWKTNWNFDYTHQSFFDVTLRWFTL